MSDLLDDARETLADISSRRPGQTHYEGCRTEHVGCLLAELIEEVERLRGYRDNAESEAAIASLAAERMRLTYEERSVISFAADACAVNDDVHDCLRIAATLRGLLERLG